ncbi:MAG: HIRAN domain-containing protein [Coriobacteriia bacterium]|nr:HIRAN domain-containing protein [Coriobacteriia bacterium]
MSEIVRIDSGNIVQILGGASGLGLHVGAPFDDPIYLVDVHVAGTTHVDNIDVLVEGLSVGDRLSFQRDKDNPYDKLAIRVMNHNDVRIGFIPCDKNEILARLMDGGKLLYGEIMEKALIDRHWNKITMRVFLDD